MSALSDAIALCTAWEANDMKAWSPLAKSVLEDDPAGVLGQLSHVAVALARALAATASAESGEPRTALQVLQELALKAENDEG